MIYIAYDIPNWYVFIFKSVSLKEKNEKISYA